MSQLVETARDVKEKWDNFNPMGQKDPLVWMAQEAEFGNAWLAHRTVLQARLAKIEQETALLLEEMRANEEESFGPLRAQPIWPEREYTGLLHLQSSFGGAKIQLNSIREMLAKAQELLEHWDQSMAIVKRGVFDRSRALAIQAGLSISVNKRGQRR